MIYELHGKYSFFYKLLNKTSSSSVYIGLYSEEGLSDKIDWLKKNHPWKFKNFDIKKAEL